MDTIPNIVIAAFYKFVRLPDYQTLQSPLLETCQQNDIYGSILLAEEGINGTIAGSRAGLEATLAFLRSDPRLNDLIHKESLAAFIPFQRMKVRLKKEIVTLGVAVDPNQTVGIYVEPHEWNDLISQPDVLLIDTRNDFEADLGTFQGAINPQTMSFSEFPAYVQQNLKPETHKKVAMFCTGGIRCEKATAYMLSQGFEEVYHLHGGILRYLEQIPPEQSLWEGECFVFDERVSVKADLGVGEARFCPTCKKLLKPNTNCTCEET